VYPTALLMKCISADVSLHSSVLTVHDLLSYDISIISVQQRLLNNIKIQEIPAVIQKSWDKP
jgi:hypothetical protein